MKVIDLLNKISNNQDVPEEIIFDETEKYIYDPDIEDYRSSRCKSYCLFRNYVFDHIDRQIRLNAGVEIVDDTSIKEMQSLNVDDEKISIYGMQLDIRTIKNKINEIIKIIKKGE